MGEAKLTSVQKVGSAYRQDADCCKRYNISAKYFSCHGAVHEDVYSEEEFSALGFIRAPAAKLSLTGKAADEGVRQVEFFSQVTYLGPAVFGVPHANRGRTVWVTCPYR